MSFILKNKSQILIPYQYISTFLKLKNRYDLISISKLNDFANAIHGL